ASTEAASFASQQQCTTGVVSLRGVQGSEEGVQHRLIRSIQLVRPVQYQLAPALVLLNADFVAHASLRHSDHDTNPSSGRGVSSSMQINSNEWPSGSLKYTLAAGIQEITTGSSIGVPVPEHGVTPARRSAATDSNTCGSATSKAMCSRKRSGEVPMDHRPIIDLPNEGTQKNAAPRA